MLVHAAATPAALGADFEGRGHISGPSDAPVSVIAFESYQCPLCALVETSLRQVRQAHPQDVRLIFITVPQAALDKDALAMQAAEAADLQGKYWEMHDLLFEKLAEWIGLSPTDFESWLAKQTTELSLSEAQFKQDLTSPAVLERVDQAGQSTQGQPARLPALFVNSASAYTGMIDFASLDTVIRMEALESSQFSACPEWVIDSSKQYLATLQTAKGQVVIELFADKSPLAVNNFVFLARSRWYDGSTFYKVIPDSIAAAGDPSGTGLGTAGYLFTTEVSARLDFSEPGMVAMDNSGLDTNGSRFLITLNPAPQLNGQYTIIGHVIRGLEVLKSLTPRDPQPATSLPDGDELVSVTIEEK
jgi:cyclophilin family peptidyl-prolyl cis-trans isomerase/protein-disulfide isomerase